MNTRRKADTDGTARAVIFVCEIGIAFCAQKIGEHVPECPSMGTGGFPTVVVLRVPSHIDHAVDRAAAAEDARLSHGVVLVTLVSNFRLPTISLKKPALRGLVVSAGEANVGA